MLGRNDRIPARGRRGQLKNYFGADGALASDGETFSFRKEQLNYANAVDDLIQANGVGMIEGGTGVGKTLGYLVPHIRQAVEKKERILIATRTKNLQDQVFLNDLPRLARTMNFKYAILKGRENYICSGRLDEAISSNELFSRTPRGRALAYLKKFNAIHPTGDLENAFDFLKRYGRDGQMAISDVRATDDTCTSDHKGTCRHYKALAAAERVDVIVANHHLALYWPETYPPVDRVVIDEAHALEDAATDVYGIKFATIILYSRLRRLYNRDRYARGLLGRIKKADWNLLGVDAIVDAIDEVRVRASTLEREFVPRTDRGTISSEDQLTAEWSQLCESAGILASAVAKTGSALSRLARDLDDESLGEKLMKNALGLQEIALGMDSLFTKAPPEDAVLWYQTKRTQQVFFHRSPLAIGPLLQSRLYARFKSVLLTSATLQVEGSFAFLSDRLGLTDWERTMPPVSVGHPFDYSERALLCLLRENESPARDVLERVVELSNGRTLALFTNKTRMLDAADNFSVKGVEVLAQYRDGSRHELARRLRKNGRSVLMGTRSFWEGIDVPGENLSVVAIEKIPFTAPGDPLYDARCRAAGDRWFMNYALPVALLTLRQGFGRLIRSESDRGVVVILDPGRASYANRILATLPPCKTVIGDEAAVLDAMREFLAREENLAAV